MKLIRLIFLMALLLAGLAAPLGVTAATPTPPPDPLSSVSGDPVCVAIPVDAANKNSGRCPAGEEEVVNDPNRGGPIGVYLVEILKLLNKAIGGLIVLVIVVAGVQYILSAGDPTRVKAAKQRITNAITALVLYLLMGAILNFLVPGGIL